MPKNTDNTEITKEGVFPPTPSYELCSYNECLNGHRWLATMAVAPCPTCKGGVLAVKKENCPYCNEPTKRMSLRSDYIPAGGGIVPRCQNVQPLGESMDIELIRHHWEEAERDTKFFLERQSKPNEAK